MSRLRNIAVVAFSQAPIVARDEHRIASEILYPEVRSALDQCDVERAAIDYQVAGAAGARTPCAQLREAVPAETLAATPWVVEPLRRGYLPPYGDSAVCLVLAAEGKAERMCDRPAWIHGVDQRIEMQTLGARDLSQSAGARLAAEKALAMAGPRGGGRGDRVRLCATAPARELILREAVGI